MAFDGFPPFISAQLHYLFTHYPHLVKIDRVWSGNKYHPRLLDRFSILIPYCLDTIKWDVIYNSDYPMAPPDIIFGSEDDDFHPFQKMVSEGVELKSANNILSDWNSRDPSVLLTLIKELRDQYVAYQQRRVGQVDDDRLKFEISTIVAREGIEMHMSSGVEKAEEVKFAVPLMDMDINKMVHGCPWRHQQKVYLQVIYPIGRKYTSVPSAPRLKLISTFELKVLLSTDDVKLPSWLDGMCMAEYLPHLEETLERQVNEAVSLIDVRRRLIEALAPLFGRPVEADPVFCRKATFLAASGTFIFLVHFFLPTQFPKQQPSLILQSLQHLNSSGVPIKSNPLTGYPWSPRWEVSQMAERILEFVSDESPSFKRFCNEALQH